MLYDRQIKYMDYIVGGERLQAAGFVKAEVRDDVCRMQIHVNGLHLSDSFERKIILRGADKDSFLKMIRIKDGKGDTGEIILNPSHMGSSGISYGGLEQIVIPIDNEREIRCIWSQKEKHRQNREMQRERIEEHAEDRELREAGEEHAEDRELRETESEKTEFAEADSAKTEYWGDNTEKRDENQNDGRKENEKTGAGGDEDMHITQITTDEIVQPRSDSQYPRDDKWSQLSFLYEHGKVFGEVSDCLLIRPGDFVILPERYYKLVNNSFLLHGYHNYGYLVLARSEKRGEVKYYVGVPGNFFEKEKQVAIMFGFESFECGKPDIVPGDFGYYMIRVEL